MKAQHRNSGLRKVCGCPRTKWPNCPHSWKINFQWKGRHHRISLDKELGHHIASKTDAKTEAERLKIAIKEDRFRKPTPKAGMTVRQLSDEYLTRYVMVKRSARVEAFTSALDVACRTAIPHPTGGTRALGEWPLVDVVPDSIERFCEAKLASGTGVPGTNRYLSSLRALWSWALHVEHAASTPFTRNGVPVIKLGEEHARSRRLENGEEANLLASAGPHLQALIVAAVETGCRRGELLSLTWAQIEGLTVEGTKVTWGPRAAIFLPHEKTKTKKDRWIPISTRLRAILEMRRLDPAGHAHPPTAFAFGTDIGTAVLGFKRAWATAVLKAHGTTPEFTETANLAPASRAALDRINLRFHDLRREAGSRWLEGGVPLHTVRDWLGHSNISQTSSYLSGTATTQHDEMARFEARVQERASSSGNQRRKAPRTATRRDRRTNKFAVGRETTTH